MSTARPPARRARAALLWGLVAFAAFQAGLVVALERWFPGLRDEEYARKLGRLRQRLAEAPERPLVLFMGTSRTLNGVIPSALGEGAPASGPAPLAFNFGHTAAGALKQQLLLLRLLRRGIHPEHIYLEVMPALLTVEGEAYGLLLQGCVGWEDWPVLRHSWPKGASRLGWYRDNLLLAVTCRERLVGHLFPWAQAPGGAWHLLWHWHARDGFFPCAFGRTAVTPTQYARGLKRSRREYGPVLRDFHIAPDEARAVRAFLDLCRRQRIGVTLVLMPEASAFRSWYGPQAAARLNAFLADLGRTYAVTVVDARAWISDRGFYDGHHLLASGALTFTRRFGREVYGPFLRRRPAR